MTRSRPHRFAPTLALALLGLLALLAPAGAGAQPAGEAGGDPATVQLLLETPSQERFVPGEVIVKMRDAAPTGIPIERMSALGLDSELAVTSGGEIVVRIAPGPAAALGATDVEKWTRDTVEALSAQPDVEYAQPNYILQIVATPNDPRFPEQWHYFDRGAGAGQAPGGIGLPTRWDTGTGDPSVVVAVIDTGILPAHPDIAGSPNLVAGFDMISIPSIANDGGGRDADPTDPGDAIAAGECFAGSPARPNSWHGTHVAGTVGVGRTNNSTGVAGVNHDARVQPVRVLGKCGGTTVDITDAIRWAAGLPVPGVPANPTPARVINLSLGGSGACSPAYQSAVDDAVAAGVTVVVAAGNDAQDAANFRPASCDDVITVAASDFRGRLVTRYSNFGATVEIMAPGGDVLRNDSGNGNDGVLSMVQGGYARYNGTSMAAPHVAGVAALLLEEDSTRTPAQILGLLQASAIPRSATECPQPCGAGLLSALPLGPAPSVTLSPASVSLRRGRTAGVVATVTSGGAPMPGATVDFSSQDAGVASVTPTTATTNASGQATATVRGERRGNTTVEAEALGAMDDSPVRVPSASTVGLALLALLALVWLARRQRAVGGTAG